MRATEHQFNSPEQVRHYLAEALEIVDELDPPDDLRGIALAKAIELVSQKQVFFQQSPVLDGLRPN